LASAADGQHHERTTKRRWRASPQDTRLLAGRLTKKALAVVRLSIVQARRDGDVGIADTTITAI
jgi:hypothetical protein